MISKVVSYFCAILCLIEASALAQVLQDDTADLATMNFTQLATNFGFASEEYDVTTDDGYILKIFRIKGGDGVPIFLQHGILDSADTFLLRGNVSIEVALAAAGHDVWFGNVRGNKYSRRHVSLNPDTDNDFWDFSIHEFGTSDLPAVIDTILAQTGHEQIAAIGHSQGTTIFYILTSVLPDYNDKIKLMISLAPICYLHNTKPMISIMIPQWPDLSDVLELYGVEEMFNSDSTVNGMIKDICDSHFMGYEICAESVMFPIAGSDPEEIDDEFLTIIAGHYPAGTSRKDMDHYGQIALRETFARFDYGWVQNLVNYGSLQPPEYNLSNIRMQVALITGKSDRLSDLVDVGLLNDQLPNVVLNHVMERESFNHLDYIWGKNMGTYMLPLLFELLETYV